MSDNAEHNAELVEQITKALSSASNTVKKEKDPKRVAAGKKLAEKNKQMKEDYARLKASEAQRATESLHEAAEPEESGEWLSKLSLTNVISMVGIGLAVYNIYMTRSSMRSKDNEKHRGNDEEWREPVTTNREEPKPKFGM